MYVETSRYYLAGEVQCGYGAPALNRRLVLHLLQISKDVKDSCNRRWRPHHLEEAS